MVKKLVLGALMAGVLSVGAFGAADAAGSPLPASDLRVVGIPVGTPFYDIQRSLGRPSDRGQFYMTYGGIQFKDYAWTDDSEADEIVITNRDATTARGIAVGDSLQDVYRAYGLPDMRQSGKIFYGYYIPNSSVMQGIAFKHNGSRVTEITVYSGNGD